MMGIPGVIGVKGERGPSGPKGNTGPTGKLYTIYNIQTSHSLPHTCFCVFCPGYYMILSVLQVLVGSQETRVLFQFPSEFQEIGALQDRGVSKDQRDTREK